MGGAASLAAGTFAIVVRAWAEGLPGAHAARCRRRRSASGAEADPAPSRPPPGPPPGPLAQVAPLLPPLAHPWLAAVQADRYYQLLVPLTVPVTIAAIALNWFSMKLFKHNS